MCVRLQELSGWPLRGRRGRSATRPIHTATSLARRWKWSDEKPTRPGVTIGNSGPSFAPPCVGEEGKQVPDVHVLPATKDREASDRTVQSILKIADLEGLELAVASTPSSSDGVNKLAGLTGVGLVTGPDTLATVAELGKLHRNRGRVLGQTQLRDRVRKDQGERC